ncbi:hypothetical protein PAXINDRAFT_78473 [Paxillus involutus ATCC 200175]|uniref:Glycosyltransferase family 25 protein n=1 Tax=Paxillus involutus ATCC 200175 TaxID=664439 RepID=A0A0C9TGK9_PAXIN|nr:hypothetical protein PAXINDRAFT_78473 [Paxillus involutus ATCC 200175]
MPDHPRGPLGSTSAHLYVISLPQRQDRRQQMEHLRAIQGLTWTVVDAVPANASSVNRILDWVAVERAQRAEHTKTGSANSTFRWPPEIDAFAVAQAPLTPLGSDSWVQTVPPSAKLNLKSSKSQPASSTTRPNLTCATEDHSTPALTNSTPEWMRLSPAKIACWHSHVSAVHHFVDRADAQMDDVAFILEDDIDMEKDIAARLSDIWGVLPPGWDTVFLGHCWSNESFYPALASLTYTNLYPSFAPKCTHAYALSLPGARRLLQHLRYPPFAYSRALDQAYAWLIQTGRLRSYSVVPSVVVQRKTVSSDILPGMGSEWRENLQDGVFGS